MRRLLPLILLSACFAQGPSLPFGFVPVTISAGHAMTLVGSDYVCSFANSSATTCAKTITSTPAGADVLITCVGTTPSSFSPTATNILAAGPQIGVDGLWIIPGITTGTTTITVTTGAYAKGLCMYQVVTGVATSSYLDVPSAGTAMVESAYSTSIPTGSVTTTNANDVMLGISVNQATSSYTAGTGYTLIGSGCSTVTAYDCAGMEYKNLSSTGANNPPLTQSVSGYVDVGTAALKLQ